MHMVPLLRAPSVQIEISGLNTSHHSLTAHTPRQLVKSLSHNSPPSNLLPLRHFNSPTRAPSVEDQVDGSRGTSSVDDVTWVVEGTDVDDVVQKIEHCAVASLQWLDDDAVGFETFRTEAIFFNRRRHRRCNSV